MAVAVVRLVAIRGDSRSGQEEVLHALFVVATVANKLSSLGQKQ